MNLKIMSAHLLVLCISWVHTYTQTCTYVALTK